MAATYTSQPPSLYIGSDECFWFECGVCSKNGHIREGIEYCMDCRVNLCQSCVQSHRDRKTYRDHRLTDRIDQKQIPPGSNGADVLPCRYCPSHPDRVVKYYCKFHDTAFCNDCAFISHSSCYGLEDMSHFEGRSKVDKAVEQIHSAVKQFKEIQQIILAQQHKVKETRQACVQEIDEIRKAINERLDRLERDSKRAVAKDTDRFVQELNRDETEIQDALESLETDTRNLVGVQAQGSSEQMFLALKRSNMDQFQTRLTEMEKRKTKVPSITFQKHLILFEVLEGMDRLGTIQATFSSPTSMSKGQTLPIDEIPHRRSAKRLNTCNIREKEDREVCEIRGSTFLPDDRLLLCDSSNRKLKLFDSTPYLISSLCLPCKPWDVGVVSVEEAVVTLPGQQSLAVVGVDSEVRLQKKICLNRKCWGVAVHDKVLFVSCHDYSDSEIVCVTLQGDIIRSISGTHPNGSILFSSPYYLTLDQRSQGLYVSSADRGSIAHLTLSGRPVLNMTYRELTQPRKLVLDKYGNILVTSKDSNTVRVISADGRRQTTLLNGSHDLKSPYAIALRERDNTFVVAMGKSDHVHVYKIL